MSLLKNTYNTRYVLINGKKSNLIRSDCLDKCKIEDVEKLKELGVKTLIDLRDLHNKKEKLSKDVLSSKLDFNNVCFRKSNFIDKYRKIIPVEEQNMPNYYMILLQIKDSVKQVFSIIKDKPGKYLVYCAIGRDRTGLISFLSQLLCGCSKEEICESYATTDKIYTEINLDLRFKEYYGYESAKAIMNALYDKFLDYYGTIFHYFELCGFSKEDIEKIIHNIKGEDK